MQRTFMFALNVTDLESSGYAEEFNGTTDEQTRQNKRETDRTSPSLISTGMLVMFNRVSSSVTIILPTDDSQAEGATTTAPLLSTVHVEDVMHVAALRTIGPPLRDVKGFI